MSFRPMVSALLGGCILTGNLWIPMARIGSWCLTRGAKRTFARPAKSPFITKKRMRQQPIKSDFDCFRRIAAHIICVAWASSRNLGKAFLVSKSADGTPFCSYPPGLYPCLVRQTSAVADPRSGSLHLAGTHQRKETTMRGLVAPTSRVGTWKILPVNR